MLAKWWGILSRPRMELAAINSHLSEEFVSQSDNQLQTPLTWQRCSDPPLGVEDAVERGSSPVLAWQREDSPQVVEGDVTLWEGALQPGFLEGGPLLLKGPGTSQIPLERGHIGSFKWQTQPQEWNGIMAGCGRRRARCLWCIWGTEGSESFPPRIQAKLTALCSLFCHHHVATAAVDVIFH